MIEVFAFDCLSYLAISRIDIIIFHLLRLFLLCWLHTLFTFFRHFGSFMVFLYAFIASFRLILHIFVSCFKYRNHSSILCACIWLIEMSRDVMTKSFFHVINVAFLLIYFQVIGAQSCPRSWARGEILGVRLILTRRMLGRLTYSAHQALQLQPASTRVANITGRCDGRNLDNFYRHNDRRTMYIFEHGDESGYENFHGHSDRSGLAYLYIYDDDDDSPYGYQVRPLNTMSVDCV